MPITARPIEQGVGRKTRIPAGAPGLSPDHAATAQGLLYRYSETMLQGPALRTNR
jgi:hypothetical protein